MLNYLTILLKRSWSKLKVLLPQVDHVPCSVQGCILPVTFLNPHQSKCQLFVVSYEPPLSFLLWGKTPLFFSMNFWFPQSIHPIRLHLGSVYMPVKSLQLCPTLCDSMDYGPPCSSVHRILQARILEWVAIAFSRASSRPRDRTCVSYVSWIGRGSLPLVPPGKHHLGFGNESSTIPLCLFALKSPPVPWTMVRWRS